MSFALARVDAGGLDWPEPAQPLPVLAATAPRTLDENTDAPVLPAPVRARRRLAGALLVAAALHAGSFALQVGLPEIADAPVRIMAVNLIAPATPQEQPVTAATPPPTPLPVPRPQPVPMETAPTPTPSAPVAAPTEPVAAATDATPAAAPLTSEARVDTDYLDNPKPAYPLMSRRLGEQGTVLLRVTVGEQGEVRAVALEESCGHARLDEAALRAVRHWRFLPAQRAGVAVTSSVLVPVTFSLAGS